MGSLDSGFYKVICSCCHQNNLEKVFDISTRLDKVKSKTYMNFWFVLSTLFNHQRWIDSTTLF